MSSRLIGFGAVLSLAVAIVFVTPAAAQWRGYSGYQPYAPGYGYDVPDQDYAPPPRAGRRAYPSQNDPYSGASYGGPSYPGDSYRSGGVSAGRADDSALNAASSERTGTMVANPTRQPPGTIVVDTRSRHLYLVLADGNAMQYGIGVGRQGFSWKGEAHVQRKAEWPAWYPPAEMIKRRPDLPEHMEGGIDNPLGARALYLYQGNKDTLFRIHGTNEPDTIGKAVSSGCIRMMNNDVVDLYSRVPTGTRVVVL